MPRTRHFRYCIHLPLAAFAFLLCTSACGIEVNGVTLPEQIKSGQHGTALVLNGAGMRTKLGFKVYVAALYLPKKNKLAEQILHSNQPSQFYMKLLRKLTARQFTDSINDALRETLTPAQSLPLESRLQELFAVFAAAGELAAGTEIVIDYEPRTGTRIGLNGERKANIPGADFNQALLRMWIGEHPRDAPLKQALLGSS